MYDVLVTTAQKQLDGRPENGKIFVKRTQHNKKSSYDGGTHCPTTPTGRTLLSDGTSYHNTHWCL